MYWKILTHDFRPPIQGGSPLCDGATWPVTLPEVPLDRSANECGKLGGWHFCREISDALKIAGFWRTGKSNAVIAVEPIGDIIERADKCRASSLTLLRRATDDEIQDGISRFSAVFGAHREAMAQEQWLWYQALGRPYRDEARVVAGLQAALAARSLPWSLRKFKSSNTARDAWAARAAWDAWDAWAARAAWDARAARAAWAAWAALTVSFAARSGWVSHPHDKLTIGLRDAYSYGLEIDIPTGPNELGWVMVEA